MLVLLGTLGSLGGLASEVRGEATDPPEGWQTLLHMSTDGEPGTRDPDFYLQDLSDRDAPKAEHEYQAALTAFFEDEDRGAICRFPARYTWLRTVTGRETTAPEVEELCETPSTPDRIRLAFPSAFVGSAASMFGHLFLTLEGEGEPLLMAEVVDFRGDPPADVGSLRYAWGGIRGQFPAGFVRDDFEERLVEYSHRERRDIWLYELSLSESEKTFLALHLEEVSDIKFAYRFFSENCGYRLLALLDAVGETRHRDRLRGTTAPSEVVRVLDEAGLLGRTSRIPSADERRRSIARSLPRDVRSEARQAARNDSLPDEEWMEAHPEGADYLFEHYVDRHRDGAGHHDKVTQLAPHLSGRELYESVNSDRHDPRGAQPYRRAELGGWSGDGGQGVAWSVRPGYRDLSDRAQGRPSGYAISFFEAQGVITMDGRPKVTSASIFRVQNFHPWNRLSRRASFGMELSGHRRADGEARGRSFGRVEAFVGPAYQRSGFTAAASIAGAVELAGRWGRASRIVAGPRADLLIESASVVAELTAAYAHDLTGSREALAFQEATVAWYPHRRAGLVLDVRRETWRFPEHHRSLSLRWHF